MYKGDDKKKKKKKNNQFTKLKMIEHKPDKIKNVYDSNKVVGDKPKKMEKLKMDENPLAKFKK